MDKNKVNAGNCSKLSDYEIMSKLGQGSFGIVYKVKRKGNESLRMHFLSCYVAFDFDFCVYQIS